MNIKKKKARDAKAIENDPILEWLSKAKDFSQKNLNLLLGVLLAGVIVAGGIMTYLQMKKSNIAKASAAFGDAMIVYNAKDTGKAIEKFNIVAENYNSTPQGYQSAYMAANLLFRQEKYDESLEKFLAVAKAGDKADFLTGQALEGASLCFEAKGDNQSAIEHLEKALVDNNYSFRHNAIKWKIALLTKNSDTKRTKTICEELVSDTLASEFHVKAENLLAMLEVNSSK